MYFIESVKNQRKWISGIFISKDDAESYLASIPEMADRAHSLRHSEFSSYPTYIVESETFELTNLAGVKSAIESVQPVENSEDIYLNLYIVNKDFRPEISGSDFMGAI